MQPDDAFFRELTMELKGYAHEPTVNFHMQILVSPAFSCLQWKTYEQNEKQ
jgi:hypothetical protein